MESILVAACIVAVPSVVAVLVSLWFWSKWITLHEKRYKLDFELEPQIRQRVLDAAARERLLLAEDQRKDARSEAAAAVNPQIFKHLGECDAWTAKENHVYRQATAEAAKRRRGLEEADV